MFEALKFDAESGIKAASYREIREALQNDFKAVFGQDMNVDPSSPDGMLIDIFAYAYNALAQNIQGIATNLNVSTARGVFLDYLANIAVGGRSEGENDEELAKRVQSADRYGYATYNGMLTYLRKNLGVKTGIQVNENNKAVEGVQPHRFIVSVPEECTLSNNEIAAHIFECKPAGIKSQGTESGTVTANGQNFTVYFSRITFVDIKFKITIKEYIEEALPANYINDIKNAVYNWAKAEYVAGKDVILQRVVIPVYSIPGILDVEVLGAKVADDFDPSVKRIEIGGAKYASVSLNNITVIKD